MISLNGILIESNKFEIYQHSHKNKDSTDFEYMLLVHSGVLYEGSGRKVLRKKNAALGCTSTMTCPTTSHINNWEW